MRREAESNRRLYESLLQRGAETGVTGELETSNIRILDAAAVPLRPVRPRRSSSCWWDSWEVVSLPSDWCSCWTRWTMPSRRRRKSGAPQGAVPGHGAARQDQVRGEGGRGTGPEPPGRGRTTAVATGAEAPADFAESVRSVRTSLIFSSADEGCRRCWSPARRPEKARAACPRTSQSGLAQMELRTLLVDADLRRPQLHSYFDLELEPGLSNYLVTDAPRDAVVRATNTPGLSLIHRREDPSQLRPISPRSARFARLVDSCRDRFDWIVLDHHAGPPRRGCTGGRAGRGSCAVRDCRGQDVAPGRGSGVAGTRPGPRPPARSRAQQDCSGASPVLLLPLLSSRVQPLLPGGAS